MNGYEKLAGLMTKHPEVATFQRFDFLNILNILFLQAELVHLEKDLRESMREDLEQGCAATIFTPDDIGSLHSQMVQEKREGNEAPGSRPVSLSGTRSTTTSDGVPSINERIESGRDWYFLANGKDTSTWDIMLQAREKLKEYSKFVKFRSIKLSNTDSIIDEAVLLQKQMKSQDSPNSCDIEFLRRWFKDKNSGNFPLIGRDSTLWETSNPSEFVAIQARRGDDPLGSVFLSRVFLWWHNCIGHRMKKPLDEESHYFEYSDKIVLRAANVLGSIISSGLLISSILALYFIDNILVRLGVMAAFTQIFSLVLILVTNAKKVEVFAATAA